MNENQTKQNGGEPDYYELYTQNSLNEAAKTFSRFNLALFVYVIVSSAIVVGTSLIMRFALSEERYEQLLAPGSVLDFLFSVVPQYLIALPILFLMVRTMKVKHHKKSKMALSEFFALFLISQAAMLIGNLIGEMFNNFFSIIKRSEVTDPVSEMINETPVWFIFIVVVVLAPIVEELIFRKLMIDRLSRYGDLIAIMTSSITFGLIHLNFYQFFYAVMVGLILGYIYAKTRDIKYSVFMHMLLNFFGSIVSLPVAKCYEKLTPQLENILNGIEVDMTSFLRNVMIVGSYSVVQYVMLIAGTILFFKAIKKREFKLNSTYEYKIPRERIASVAILNPGTVLLLVLAITFFVINIVL